MKKTLSFALALVLCLGLTLPACAAENTDNSAKVSAKAGDTTVTDKNGNTYTPSNPVLYTVPFSNLAGLNREDGEPFEDFDILFCGENIDVIYAVPAGTIVTPPSNRYFKGLCMGSDIIWKDGGCFLSWPYGISDDTNHLWTSFELGDSEMIAVLECYDGILESVPDNVVSDKSLFGTKLGTIAFYVPGEEHSSANPFVSSTAPSTPETPNKTVFTDVAAGAYYEDAVAWAVTEGITSGTTASTFSPNDTCTISQILTFLWRANGSPEPTIQNPYPNIKETAYYYKPLLWAVEQKLIGSDTYEDGWPCTRGMTVFFMWKVSGAEFDQGAFEKQLFDDVPLEDSNTFVQPVYWAVKNGVTSGTSATTFSPEAICTRGQIVTFLYRAFAH